MVREDLCPVDLAAVQADDVFLDLLGSNGQVSDDELARVLVAWRRDVDSEPVGELVSIETALAAIEAGRKPQRNWCPVILAAAAVFAVLVIVAAGPGLAPRTSAPGDWLWPLHEVLYSGGAK